MSLNSVNLHRYPSQELTVASTHPIGARNLNYVLVVLANISYSALFHLRGELSYRFWTKTLSPTLRGSTLRELVFRAEATKLAPFLIAASFARPLLINSSVIKHGGTIQKTKSVTKIVTNITCTRDKFES